MSAEYIALYETGSYEEGVAKAAAILESGGVVAFPTETVYGVGCRADLPAALERLRNVKQRDADKPLTVHIGRKGEVARYVSDIPRFGRRFIKRAWPGPLTLIFPVADPDATAIVREGGPAVASALYRNGTVGIRCPDDAVAGDILGRLTAPIVASSANLAGSPPLHGAPEIMAELGDRIDLILDAGPPRLGKPSTVVQLNGVGYRVVREGAWDERTVRRLGQLSILFVCTGNTCRSPMAEAMGTKMLADAIGAGPRDLEHHGIIVRSAGVAAGLGGPASTGAETVMRERGLDLSRHCSSPLTPELIHQADHVYAMTAAHLDAVRAMSPSAAGRTALLRSGLNIEDPHGRDLDVYRACADTIAQALTSIVAEVLE